jgi:DNA-binding HxlR family transcriptional regulator
MESRRIYRHFCMMARTLELVGERWSLLIVRDLLLGPRRFTDLVRSLREITPTRLTDRLRHLESAGIVAREPPTAGREVWYRLTDSGHDLQPVVEALILWGIQHAFEPPRDGEPVEPAPVMIGTKVWLDQRTERPGEPVAWAFHFPDHETYALRLDGGAWVLARGQPEDSDVAVHSTLEAWARFFTAPTGSRKLAAEAIRLEGEPAAIKAFTKTFAADR